MTVFRITYRSARKSIIVYVQKYSFEHKDTNRNKSVVLVDGASDYLQIWMAVSSLNIKSKKAIKIIICFSR